MKAVFPVSAFSKGDLGARIDGTAADFSAALKAQLPPPPAAHAPKEGGEKTLEDPGKNPQ